MAKDKRGCREHNLAPGYEGYNKVNCASCPMWDGKRCRDIAGVLKRYEDTPDFVEFRKMMQENKGVHIDG
jgi:hypothetical protein